MTCCVLSTRRLRSLCGDVSGQSATSQRDQTRRTQFHMLLHAQRVEALGLMQDAGMRVDPTTFLGDIVSPTK
jgi:hypothetical protein